MGAHPDAPSSLTLPGGSTLPGGGALSLVKYIHDYPMKSLGEEVFSEFGDLPFLFKALSASMPLSIQVHPDKARVEAGFEREEMLRIPRTAPERNYKDRNHKPELAVALSPFSALCGFRQANEAAEMLGFELCEFFSFSAGDAEASLRRLLRKALSSRDRERTLLESKALSRARELSKSADGKARIAGETTLMCFQHYPHDPGAISPLFMNVFFFEPGQGVYIPAGVMHAYLKGTILEIMATSDNVIRGGLTHKHIDVDDLLGSLDFKAEPILVEPQSSVSDAREAFWPTPAREFSLSRFGLHDQKCADTKPSGPEILLCTEGQVSIGFVSGNGPSIVLKRGESAFISASCASYSLRGPCTVFRAGVGSLASPPESSEAAL
jgi:mannose-6-phosphate isomerase